MAHAQAHRGPDGEGERVLEANGRAGRRVGLAHRRLAIIDLSVAGTQPMTLACPHCGVHGDESDPSGATWLTYNGEIYNFRELRAELQGKGHRFRSQTDSEVLLHLYVDEGPAMLERLNGIFALALYDGRPRGQKGGVRPGDVLVARDGLGIKPLYYATLEEGVLFASEIKALLQSRSVSRELSPLALHYHLAYLWSPAPTTILEGVRKLPPGEAMLLRDGRVHRQWSHYDLPYGRAPRTEGREALAGELREHLRTAVERQLVADVPVGAFLSGGLDSSAVVAMMRQINPDIRPRCYSIGFTGNLDEDGLPVDLPYARRVAEHLDVDLRTIEIEADSIQNLERMLFHLDEPQADPAPISALLIAEEARKDGIRVLLSGAGGDDIFSGYRRHFALRAEHLWSWLPGTVRSGVAASARWLGSESALQGVAGWHLLRRSAKALAGADLPQNERIANYFWWSGEALRRTLYTPELAARLDGVSTSEPLLQTLRRIPDERDPLNRMLYLEAKHFLADHNLNYTDKMGMAAGVEVRVPLLDPDLIDFATRVPSGMKQRGRTGKAIFKEAMEPFLPHDIIYRPKTGFGAPLRRWLRQELREQVEDTLSPSSLQRRGLFDPAAVASLVERDRRGMVDGAYTIFSLVCIELWCRMFVDVPVPSAMGAEAVHV